MLVSNSKTHYGWDDSKEILLPLCIFKDSHVWMYCCKPWSLSANRPPMHKAACIPNRSFGAWWQLPYKKSAGRERKGRKRRVDRRREERIRSKREREREREEKGKEWRGEEEGKRGALVYMQMLECKTSPWNSKNPILHSALCQSIETFLYKI